MSTIDRLELEIEVQARNANKQLDLLNGKLTKLSQSLTSINSSGLSTLAGSVQKFASAASQLGNVKTADFTRTVKNIEKISSLNTSQIYQAASSMTILSKSLNNMGSVSKSSVQVAQVAKDLSKLGGANVQKAITNLPQLAVAMNKLMTTLSKAPQVSKNVIQMTNSLVNLASQGSKVGTATSSINKNILSYSNSAKKATKSTTSLAASIGKFYASAFLAIRGVKALGRAIESSMDMTETVNYMNVVLKKMSSEWENAGYSSGKSYAKALQSEMNELTGKLTGFIPDESGNLSTYNMGSLGMNLNDVIKYQASFAQLASSMGLTAKTSVNLSKALTMLGADISSVKNMDLDVVYQKLASGIVGQSRAVRDLGGEITQVTLQEYAMDKGLTQSIQSMNQATKAQLRLIAMLDQLDFAFGDMAFTINSAANSYRVFTNQVKNLAIILGNLFIPIISKVLPYINGLVIALQRLFTWVGGKIFGAGWLENVNTSIGGAADGMGDLVGGTDDYEQSLEDANKAANKLKSTVLGIDELNINAPETDSGGANKPSGGGGGGIPELDTAIADALKKYEDIWNDAFESMENKAQEFADKITAWFQKAWKAIEPFRESLKKLWDEGLSKLADFTWTALADFYNEFLVPIGKWAFGTEGAGLTRLVDIINNSLMKINWERLNKSLKDFWIAIEPYAEQFGEGLIDFFEDVSNFAVDVINAFPGLLDKITGVLNNGDPTKARDWGYALGQLAVGIIAIKLAFKGFIAVEAGIAFFKRIQEVVTWFGGTKVGIMISKLPSLSSVIMGFANVLSYIGMVNPALLPAVFDKLALEFPKLADAFSWFTDPEGILGIINGWLFDIVDGIANMVKSIPSAIKSIFDNTFNWDSTFELFNKAFENFSLAFEGKDIAINILKGIGNGLLGAIGFLIEPIGDLFSGLWNAICNVFGIHSPAKSMYPIGENILLGVVEGFVSKFSEFSSAIETWWNEYVAPWFTIEQWSLLWENIKLAFVTKWQELVEWWNTSALFLWWEESVAPWFTIETWSDLLSNIQIAFTEVWGKLVKWWNESAIGKWWNENVSPYFTLKFWSDGMKGIIDAFKQVFKNAANGAIEIFNKLIEWINEKMHFEWDAITILGKEIVPSGSAQLFTIPEIPKFELGGFPEDGLFFANHNELVGQFSNGRTAVANNDMITSGIEEAAYRGFARANAENNQEAGLLRELIEAVREGKVIEIDGREIVSVMDERRARNGYPLTT